ncbi:conserved hypothetical protein [gamma proteobacterium NOR5-3]|nr:conserved hypothetical protein [gamma proteobacterium NOR5-3]
MTLGRGLQHLGRLLLCALLTVTASTHGSDEDSKAGQGPKPASPTRVLFVGNSYLYYNDSLHNHVKRMVEELRPDIADHLKYKSATIGGARLSHHNIDWLLTPGQIGVAEPFELVVMQGGSAEVLSDDARSRFYATASTYADKVRESGAEPMLYMTHAYVPPHRRARPGMIDEVAAAYLEAGKQAEARVVPVGLSFDESYRRRPEFNLHMSFDGTHPNIRGTYLAACTVYLSLYGGSLEALSYDYFGELPPEEAAYLRSVATAVVDDFAGH